MPKRAKKTPSTCEQHLFILKPKHSFCRFGQTVTVSFCDPGNDKGKGRAKKCRNCQRLDCPIFNNDRNFATPTFILNSQKVLIKITQQYYDERGMKMREQHERKMIEYTDEKDSLNVPKPRTRNNFCSVCRQVYEDYLEHIDSQKHKKKINSSLFNRYILDAAEKFNPTPKNLFTYSYPTLSTRDQEELELLEMGNKPIKKIKSDHQVINERFGYGQQQQDMMRNQQILPPPHLNLSNSAYFPGLGGNMPSLSYFPNLFIPQQMNPQMTFNYNMNFFWPPSYFNPQQAFGMINPSLFGSTPATLDFFPTMNSMNNSFYQQQQKLQYQHLQHLQQMQNYAFQNNKYGQEKRESLVNANKDSIIVIDDDGQAQCESKQYNVA